MKEFIDKLIERLEEEKNEAVASNVRWAYSKTISIVNELAEEYNNDFCEWKPHHRFEGFVRAGCRPTSLKLEHATVEFEFCPYCGKKIKVAPYTEGE